MKLTHLLTPLVRSEIADLLQWIRHCPCLSASRPLAGLTWHLAIDCEWLPQEMELLRRHINHSALCGVTIDFLSAGLSREESVYLRNLPHNAPCNLLFGSKSGPNLQFFRCLEKVGQASLAEAHEALVLLEVDAIPIRPFWIDGLDAAIASLEPFWIAGSRYRGRSPLSPAIEHHLNGNAIYGIGHPDFSAFLQAWKRILITCVAKRHFIAYDIALDWFGYYQDDLGMVASASDAELLAHAREMFRDLTGTILNLSGEYEITSGEVDLSQISPETVIVHSKPLIRHLGYALGEDGLCTQAMALHHPLNKRHKALEGHLLQYLSVDDAPSFSPKLFEHVVASHSFLTSPALVSLLQACLSQPQPQHDHLSISQ